MATARATLPLQRLLLPSSPRKPHPCLHARPFPSTAAAPPRRAVATAAAIAPSPRIRDVIEAQQFDRGTLDEIFEVAREMETVERDSHRNPSRLLEGYLMATLFYEPSTRTRLSFECAMRRLGGEVLTTENAREFSSAAKGETLEGDRLPIFIPIS
jgi:aspartate carbamoyltransferase catalytic subunit